MRGHKLQNEKGIAYIRYMEHKTRMAAEAAKGSTGAFGKSFEVQARYYTSTGSRYASRATAYKCRQPGKVDGKLYGKNAEYKTGCGVVAYNVNGINVNDIFPNSSYICWCPFTEGINEQNFELFSYIFTRDEFIQLLYEMGSVKKAKGEFTVPTTCDKMSVTYHANRRCVNITDFTRSEGKLAVLWSWLEGRKTLQDYVNEMNMAGR